VAQFSRALAHTKITMRTGKKVCQSKKSLLTLFSSFIAFSFSLSLQARSGCFSRVTSFFSKANRFVCFLKTSFCLFAAFSLTDTHWKIVLFSFFLLAFLQLLQRKLPVICLEVPDKCFGPEVRLIATFYSFFTIVLWIEKQV